MSDILEILRNAYSVKDPTLAKVIAEIVQLRADLTTCRADAMEECAKAVQLLGAVEVADERARVYDFVATRIREKAAEGSG